MNHVTDPRTFPASLSIAGTPDTLTAHEALAWCWPTPGQDVVGFGYAVDRAVWFRLAASGTLGPDGKTLGLDRMYEVVAFDTDRELRWLLDTDGATHTVVLAEDTGFLPAGTCPVPGPALRRLTPDYGPQPAHLLAEHAARPGDLPAGNGWATLRSRRYHDALVPYRWPVAADPPAGLALEYVEYVAEDEHGNLTVVETRLTGIRAHHPTRRSEQPRQETR